MSSCPNERSGFTVPQSKSITSGLAQLAVAVLVIGGALLLGGVASNASAGRTGQSQIDPCATTTTWEVPAIAAQTKPGDPCVTTTTEGRTTTTTTEPTTTTMVETTTTMVETSTSVAPTTTTAPKPAVQPRVLARTGSNTMPMVALAMGLLVAGGAVLMTAARKRTA